MITAPAAPAVADELTLVKKSEICRELAISGPQFEKLLEAGRLPAAIWLGPTPHSRRWYASVIRTHLETLRAMARRRRQPQRKPAVWA